MPTCMLMPARWLRRELRHTYAATRARRPRPLARLDRGHERIHRFMCPDSYAGWAPARGAASPPERGLPSPGEQPTYASLSPSNTLDPGGTRCVRHAFTSAIALTDPPTGGAGDTRARAAYLPAVMAVEVWVRHGLHSHAQRWKHSPGGGAAPVPTPLPCACRQAQAPLVHHLSSTPSPAGRGDCVPHSRRRRLLFGWESAARRPPPALPCWKLPASDRCFAHPNPIT
jgi:hypothetical protein